MEQPSNCILDSRPQGGAWHGRRAVWDQLGPVARRSVLTCVAAAGVMCVLALSCPTFMAVS